MIVKHRGGTPYVPGLRCFVVMREKFRQFHFPPSMVISLSILKKPNPTRRGNLPKKGEKVDAPSKAEDDSEVISTPVIDLDSVHVPPLIKDKDLEFLCDLSHDLDPRKDKVASILAQILSPRDGDSLNKLLVITKVGLLITETMKSNCLLGAAAQH